MSEDPFRSLSVRVRNCLDWKGIRTVKQLAALDRRELRRWRNFGEASLAEVELFLGRVGLWVGMSPEALGDVKTVPELLDRLITSVEALEDRLASMERMIEKIANPLVTVDCGGE